MAIETSDDTLGVTIEGPDVGGWPLSIPRQLWFQFLSAAYGMGIEEHEALELAFRRFVEAAEAVRPSLLDATKLH